MLNALTRRQLISAAFAPPRRPNFLFLFPDQQRHDWATGLVRTPHLDALAKRGVRFTQAVVSSPLCAPSRACLAAGKEYQRCGVANNRFDYPLTQTTYYRLLRDAGYHVMGCGKLDLHKATEDWGLDGKRLTEEWGFSDAMDNAGKFDALRSGRVTPKDPYMAYLHQQNLAATHVADFDARRGPQAYVNTAPTPLPEDAYCDNWIGENGLKLLRRAPVGQPWHLVVNFTGPHDPMDVTRRMEQTTRGRRYPAPHRNTQHPPAKHQEIRQNYAAMIENLDRWTGRFLDEVKRRGELDNTLIVYSSDHGEMLGDHNLWGKSLPHEASIRVPLIMAGPRVKRAESRAMVYVHDLAATFLDYAGVKVPPEMDSRSLRPLLEGKTRTHRDYQRTGLNKWRTVFDGRWKLVEGYGENGPRLYDLAADPTEDNNLAARETATLERLRHLAE